MDLFFECGLDEAGRGPLAGPVVAACVVLPNDFPIEFLNDSKKLSPKKREKIFPLIKEKACWGMGVVSHEKIDEINILQASLYAMELAYKDMVKKLPQWLNLQNIKIEDDLKKHLNAIVDGNKLPQIDCAVKAEVKADGKYASVMAASILAKVERDNMMNEYDKMYPQYNYAKHKGYPTKEHVSICKKIGPSPIQRMSFKY